MTSSHLIENLHFLFSVFAARATTTHFILIQFGSSLQTSFWPPPPPPSIRHWPSHLQSLKQVLSSAKKEFLTRSRLRTLVYPLTFAMKITGSRLRYFGCWLWDQFNYFVIPLHDACFSWSVMVLVRWWLDSNPKDLVLKMTTLPSQPSTLPRRHLWKRAIKIATNF